MMKKTSILLIMTVLLLVIGCNSSKKSDQPKDNSPTEMTNTDSSTREGISLLDNKDLPQSIDFTTDINDLTLQELRLLYNYVYAIHGMHFNEADLYAFFKANTNWYEKLITKLWEEEDSGGNILPLKYSDVKLTTEEQAFVDKIEGRIKELKIRNFKTIGGQTLGNVNNIVNLFQFVDIDDNFKQKLNDNNFVITTGSNLQLFHVYEENDYRQLPNFITTDLYLQAFHMYFSYTLKSLEQNNFIPILSELCLGMYNESKRLKESKNPEIKAMAEYNMVYYAVPYYFLANQKLSVPAIYQKQYEQEINNINKHEDNTSDFLDFKNAYFPYSLFKPRGHYTRKPEMQNYFKAMMWLQTAPFCRDNHEQLKQTIFSSVILNSVKAENGKMMMDLYRSVYDPIVFLVGLPDNLSFMDIAEYLSKEKLTDMESAMTPFNIAKVNQMLVDLSKTRNQIKPKAEVSCPDKINFMPQRYLIDNDVIQNLVDIKQNAKRAYPRGLDVFAAFGSNSANELLTDFYREKDNWSSYPDELLKMKTKFYNYKGWNSSVYNKWIESLLELQKTDKNYPGFMQTKAWGYKNLNTSLASWAELKHDAILYGEQPSTAECGDGGPPLPVVRGYIEPNLKFWKKLKEMIKLTKDLLSKNKLLTDDLKGKTEELSNYIDFLIQITQKELAKETLSEEEYSTIQYMGSSIEYFSLSVLDPDLDLFDWSLVQGADKSIAVVADIYTRNVLGCEKDGILHVATGNANNIYVVVEINGYLYLTKGATFSYYEFVQPLGTRLTDEEWQKMLEEKKAPSTQEWMKDIIIEKGPKIDERVFYSSGC